MRIWHTQLIPKLCTKHLCAMWREGLGAYNIITQNKQGYRNHPATQEFIHHPTKLWHVLEQVRAEMLSRGYHPKPMPCPILSLTVEPNSYRPWQTLHEQIAVLQSKHCKCNI